MCELSDGHRDVVLEVVAGLLLCFGLIFPQAPKMLLLLAALGQRRVDDGPLLKSACEERLEHVFQIGVGAG